MGRRLLPIFVCVWYGLFGMGMVPIGHAVELTEGPYLEFRGKLATVRWKTDVVSGAKVRYGQGQTTERWQSRSAKAVGTEHEVMIDGLLEGEDYQYTVGTARRVLFEGSFKVPGDGVKMRPSQTPSSATDSRAPPQNRKPSAPDTGKTLSSEKRGQAASEKPVPTPPPLRAIWGSMDSLQDHYERHGADFQSKSAEHYAQQSWWFLQRAIDEGLPAKLDSSDGTVRVFDPKSGAFAAYRRDGKTRTYFKPGSRDYFQRQPGNPVRLTRAKR